MRLYPDENQPILLEKHFGSCRFVWNHFLDVGNKYYAEHKNDKKKDLSGFDTIKMLPQLKKEKTWLNEINSQSFQHSLVQLDKAFKSFFKHNTAYPTFMSKKDNHYFIVPSGFKAIGNKLIIPKFIEGVKYRDKSTIPEKIKQIVVTKDVNRYYASIQHEVKEEFTKGSAVAGIDMRVKHFLTTSYGIQIEPLNLLRKKGRKLKREQRRLLAKKKRSENRKKEIGKVQKMRERQNIDIQSSLDLLTGKERESVSITYFIENLQAS